MAVEDAILATVLPLYQYLSTICTTSKKFCNKQWLQNKHLSMLIVFTGHLPESAHSGSIFLVTTSHELQSLRASHNVQV